MSLQIEDPDRGTGRTTRRALAYVHLLINRPGEKIFIRDHCGMGHTTITHMVSHLLEVLNIQHHRDQSDNSITVVPLVRNLTSMELPDV